jgi:hypothetical protein
MKPDFTFKDFCILMGKALWYLVLLIWQLPQHIVAAGVFVLLEAIQTNFTYTEDRGYHHVISYKKSSNNLWFSGCSLGFFIILPESRLTLNTIGHEYGHSKQSLYLGPLYLLLVGLPSLFWNILSRFSKKIAAGYYTRYPEKWADKLGGVVRD